VGGSQYRRTRRSLKTSTRRAAFPPAGNECELQHRPRWKRRVEHQHEEGNERMQATKYVSGDRTAMTNVLPRSAISSRATYRNALGLRRNQYPETDLGQLAFFFDLPVEAAKPETIIERLDGPTTMGEFIERWRTPIAA
jgi:hypothetical protein